MKTRTVRHSASGYALRSVAAREGGGKSTLCRGIFSLDNPGHLTIKYFISGEDGSKAIEQKGRQIMKCNHCGKDNEAGARFCSGCGAHLSDQQPKISNHMGLAIVSCFCFLIPGIIALVYSDKVNKALARGDYAEARSASSTAQTWAIVGIVIGTTLTVALCSSGYQGGY